MSETENPETVVEVSTASPLLEPRTPFSHVITSNEEFSDVIAQLEKGSGPIAIDAERASGYKYSQRAYLVQIFRRGGGLHLIDPIAANSRELWQSLGEIFSEVEWIIHASTQDLPCLTELGFYPRILFDTELGGRIAGFPRVGLGPMAESLLELALAKEHSAVDWSKRPLNPEWLIYAALDVDVLVDLRDKVYEVLEASGKLKWAQADFAHILSNYSNPSAAKNANPNKWRKTSGMHKVRDRRTLGLIKVLWEERDAFAQKIDIAPGRIFNDEALIATAIAKPKTLDEVRRLLTRRTKVMNQPLTDWFEAIRHTMELPADQLPELRVPSTNLPPPKLWRERNPLGYARLSHARAATLAKAEELNIPVENLISPDALRKLCWPTPPINEVDGFIRGLLTAEGVREWQLSQIAPLLPEALAATEPIPAPPAEAEASADSE